MGPLHRAHGGVSKGTAPPSRVLGVWAHKGGLGLCAPPRLGECVLGLPSQIPQDFCLPHPPSTPPSPRNEYWGAVRGAVSAGIPSTSFSCSFGVPRLYPQVRGKGGPASSGPSPAAASSPEAASLGRRLEIHRNQLPEEAGQPSGLRHIPRPQKRKMGAQEGWLERRDAPMSGRTLTAPRTSSLERRAPPTAPAAPLHPESQAETHLLGLPSFFLFCFLLQIPDKNTPRGSS